MPHDLGDLVRTHAGSPWRRLVPACVLLLLAVGGVYAIATMEPPDPAKVWMVVVLFVALAVAFLWIAVLDAAARLDLRERGLVYTRSGRPRAVRFADVAAAVERRINGRPVQLILELRGGGTIEVSTALVDYPAAAQAIARAI